MERQEFRCTACGQTFNTSEELDNHKEQMHQQMQEPEPDEGEEQTPEDQDTDEEA